MSLKTKIFSNVITDSSVSSCGYIYEVFDNEKVF